MNMALRATLLCTLAFGLQAVAMPAAAVDLARLQKDVEKMQRVGERVGAGAAGDVDAYLRGEPEQALARLRAFDKGRDWYTPMVLGNMTWLLHPEESLAWTQQALERGAGHTATFELGLHYTRREECEQALAAWEQVGDQVGGYYHGVVAYCQFKLGRDADALATMDRFQYGRPGRFEALLEEIWGGRPALGKHAYLLADYKAGKDVSLDALLATPFGLEGSQQARALLAILDAAAARGDARSAIAELACLKPALEADVARAGQKGADPYDLSALDGQDEARASRWKSALERCGLMIGSGRLPASSRFARQLLLELQGMGLLTPADMLARHGAELQRRAGSEEGDFEALDLLAALQSSGSDRAGVAASDQLGWHRYRQARYAASALLGEIVDGHAPGKDYAARVRAAYAEFPDDGLIAWLAVEQGELPPAELKVALRAVILAEFHHPSQQQVLHFGASARILFEAIGRYRELLKSQDAAPVKS